MKRFVVLGFACAFLMSGAHVGWAFDSTVVLPLEYIGDDSIPVVNCVEYSQQWVGSFGPVTDAFVWENRVGFRVTQQIAGTELDLTGYGFTYGDVTLKNEYWDGTNRPAMTATIWAVEDPTDGYDGYYGRVWGETPEYGGSPAQPFEGTVKFRETDSGMEGEVVLIRNVGGQGTYECYGEPLPLKATLESEQSVSYEQTTPMALYANQALAGTVSGTMNGNVALTVDSIRLGEYANPGSGQTWAYMKEGDGCSVGEAETPEEVGTGRTWLVIQRDEEIQGVDTYDGLFQAYEGEGTGKMPAFTTDGEFSFGDYTFRGIAEQLTNLPGDLNGDEEVNSSDLDIVRANWGTNPLSGEFLKGDSSRDGFVGSGDLDLVRANWGAHAAASAVPEPGTLALLLGVALAGLARRRR